MKSWLTYSKNNFQIPPEIMTNDELTLYEKFILALFVHMSNWKDEVKFSSSEMIGGGYPSKAELNKTILALKNKGFILEEKLYIKTRIFKINKNKILEDYHSYLGIVIENLNNNNRLKYQEKILSYFKYLQNNVFNGVNKLNFFEKYAKINTRSCTRSMYLVKESFNVYFSIYYKVYFARLLCTYAFDFKKKRLHDLVFQRKTIRVSKKPYISFKNFLNSKPLNSKSIKAKIASSCLEEKILETWYETSPNIIKHRNKNSKTYKNILHSIKELKNGTFTSKKSWDTEWLKSNNIPEDKFFSEKINTRNLIKTLKGPIKNLYTHGYWPPNKKTLPRNFLDLLYNSNTGKSFFFLAYYCEIKKSNADKFPQITEYLIKQKIIDPKFVNWFKYNQNLQELSDFFQKKIKNGGFEIYNLYQNSFEKFIAKYAEFLLGNDEQLECPKIKNLHYLMFEVEFWTFKAYIEAVNNFYGNIFKL